MKRVTLIIAQIIGIAVFLLLWLILLLPCVGTLMVLEGWI